MATNKTYVYYNKSVSQKRSLTSEGAISIGISSCNGNPHKPLYPQDPPLYALNDCNSICRQFLWHLVALLRLGVVLCIVTLKLVAGLCHSLVKRVLGWLDTTLIRLPLGIQLHEALISSQIHNRWPAFGGLLGRSVISPVHEMPSSINLDDRRRDPPCDHPNQESDILLEGQVTHACTFILSRCSPVSTAQYEYTGNRLSTSQRVAPLALDDIPTLEERPLPTSMSGILDKSSVSPDHSPESNQRTKKATLRHPLQHHIESGNQRDDFDPERSDRFDPSASMPEEGYCSSVTPPQAISQSEKRFMTPLHIFDEPDVCLARDHARTYDAGASSADVETSALSSDLANAEAFSPVHLPLPHRSKTIRLTGVRTISTGSSQSRLERDQPASVPTLGVSSSALHAEQSPTTYGSSCGITSPSETSPTIPKWIRRSLRSTPDIQTTFNDSAQLHEYPDFRGSRRTSSCGGPSPPTTRLPARRRSEADRCNETCFSCETCDRRHKRNRQSRIPRRVDALEHHRGRSSGLDSCYFAQPTGLAASGAGGGKLPRRKAKTAQSGKPIGDNVYTY